MRVHTKRHPWATYKQFFAHLCGRAQCQNCLCFQVLKRKEVCALCACDLLKGLAFSVMLQTLRFKQNLKKVVCCEVMIFRLRPFCSRNLHHWSAILVLNTNIHNVWTFLFWARYHDSKISRLITTREVRPLERVFEKTKQFPLESRKSINYWNHGWFRYAVNFG